MKYDLLTEPWIPVLAVSGQPVHVGLLELFERGPELRALAPETPDIASGLYRLLLAILHRAYDGPKDLHAWRAIWMSRRFDLPRIAAYLERWRHRFDLWDPEHPFLQDPRIPTSQRESVSRLFVELAQGNNPTLFDHTVDNDHPIIDAATAARRLLGSQVMALCGRIPGGSKEAKDSPFARHVTFLVLGDSLFHTLTLNLVVYDHKRPIPSTAQDSPSWEQDIRHAGTRTPEGHLDFMTWRSRRVRLIPSDDSGRKAVGVAAAGEADRFEGDTFRDAFAACLVSKDKGPVAVRISPERALWRDSLPFFVNDEHSALSPASIRQVAHFVADGLIPHNQVLRVMAIGFATELGKQKKRMGRIETLPIPAALLAEPRVVPMIQRALSRATDADRAVRSAAFVAAKLSLSVGERSPDAKEISSLADSTGTQAVYWSTAGRAFPQLLLDLSAERHNAETAWARALRAAAEGAFRCVEIKLGASSRGYKAVTLGRAALARRLSAALPVPDEQEVGT